MGLHLWHLGIGHVVAAVHRFGGQGAPAYRWDDSHWGSLCGFGCSETWLSKDLCFRRPLLKCFCRTLIQNSTYDINHHFQISGCSKFHVVLQRGMVDSNNDPTFVDIAIPANTSNSRPLTQSIVPQSDGYKLCVWSFLMLPNFYWCSVESVKTLKGHEAERMETCLGTFSKQENLPICPLACLS